MNIYRMRPGRYEAYGPDGKVEAYITRLGNANWRVEYLTGLGDNATYGTLAQAKRSVAISLG